MQRVRSLVLRVPPPSLSASARRAPAPATAVTFFQTPQRCLTFRSFARYFASAPIKSATRHQCLAAFSIRSPPPPPLPYRLSHSERTAALADLPQWTLVPGRDAISREFVFKNFSDAWAFMSASAVRAAEADHHPEWFNVCVLFIRMLLRCLCGCKRPLTSATYHEPKIRNFAPSRRSYSKVRVELSTHDCSGLSRRDTGQASPLLPPPPPTPLPPPHLNCHAHLCRHGRFHGQHRRQDRCKPVTPLVRAHMQQKIKWKSFPVSQMMRRAPALCGRSSLLVNTSSSAIPQAQLF
jgi:pterin-4a-carbinolamine dehydratase